MHTPPPAVEHRLACRHDNNPALCRCTTHIDPRFYVPCCPFHHAPLELSDREDPRGFCPECYTTGAHAHHTIIEWAWLHQDTFNADELPPINGRQPIRLGDPVEAVIRIRTYADAKILEDVLTAPGNPLGDYFGADLIDVTLVYAPAEDQATYPGWGTR